MSELAAIFYERLEACEQQYALHFAGQVRATRDPDMLGSLIEEVESIAAQSTVPEVVTAAREQARAYRQEREAIVEALAQAGPQGRLAANLARWASLIMHRYTRHFAGRSRADRDVGLISEMQEDLREVHISMQSVAPAAAESVQEFLALLEREHDAIVMSRHHGGLDNQAALWAGAANKLISTFAFLCAERRRLAVRPELIARLQHVMQTVHDEMVALRTEGLRTPHHDEAVAHLANLAVLWREEYDACRQLRAASSPFEIGEALEAELDDILAEYNDNVDQNQEASRLSTLCDRADECAKQLRESKDGTQAQTACDTLALLCTAFDAVAALAESRG